MNRRELLKAGVASGALAGTAGPAAAGARPLAERPIQDRICLFTDHLDDHGDGYGEVAGMLKQLGISGPDLTVRSGGLVAPERAAEELPKAVAAFRDQGLTVPMISTGITSAAEPAARPILTTAGKLGIPYFKLGYYSYSD